MKHRALFFLMSVVVQTAQLLFNQEQTESRAVCSCANNRELLLENKFLFEIDEGQVSLLSEKQSMLGETLLYHEYFCVG